jgi:hypothetical protein
MRREQFLYLHIGKHESSVFEVSDPFEYNADIERIPFLDCCVKLACGIGGVG